MLNPVPLLLVLGLASTVMNHAEESRPGLTRISGAQHPEAIKPAHFIPRVLGALQATPPPIDLDLPDAVAVARFGYDWRMTQLQTELLRRDQLVETLCSASPRPTPGDVAALFEGHQQEDMERNGVLWQSLLEALSAPVAADLERLVDEEIIPEIDVTDLDYRQMWRAMPEQFEQMLERLCRSAAPSQAEPPRLVASSRAVRNTVVVVGGQSNGPETAEGLEMMSWREIRTFAVRVEPALIRQLITDHGLDTSDDIREAWVRQHMPQALDPQPPAHPQAQHRQQQLTDAITAVMNGEDPTPLYHQYALAEIGLDEEAWSSLSSLPTHALQRLRRGMSRDRSLPQDARSLIAADLVTRGVVAEQLVMMICGQDASLEHTACREQARQWYLEYADAQVSDGPTGWLDGLTMFRPESTPQQ